MLNTTWLRCLGQDRCLPVDRLTSPHHRNFSTDIVLIRLLNLVITLLQKVKQFQVILSESLLNNFKFALSDKNNIVRVILLLQHSHTSLLVGDLLQLKLEFVSQLGWKIL